MPKYRTSNFDPNAGRTPNGIDRTNVYEKYTEAVKTIAEIDVALAHITPQTKDRVMGSYYQKQADELQASRAQLSEFSDALQHCQAMVQWEFENGQRQQRADRDAANARLAQHRAEAAQQRERELTQHDSILSAFDWSLTGIEDIDAQREIARDFAEKLAGVRATNSELDAALERADILAEVAVKNGVSVDQIRSALTAQKQSETLSMTVNVKGRFFEIWGDGQNITVAPDAVATVTGGETHAE